MKMIWQLLKKPSPTKGDVGIEIEVEGENLQVVADGIWRTEADGSLRGRFPDSCAEYVLDNPLPISKVKQAIEALAKAQEKATLNFSFRTSVHVHINVQELSPVQVLNMIYTYLLIEEALMMYCGKERKANRFCLRLQDAEDLLNTIRYMIQMRAEDWKMLNEQSIRYAAINIAAINKYGSIEFRAMHGNMSPAIIHNWASALVQLREYARSGVTPVTIYEQFCELGPVDFLKKVLGDWHTPFLYPKMEKDLQKSFSLSIDIPFLFKQNIGVHTDVEAPLEAP